VNPAPLLVSPPRDGPIIDLGSEHRYEGEYDQHPRRKASVPNESVNHECDSSFDAAGRPRQPLPEKSAVLGRDGGFSFADLQHPPKSQSAIFRAGVQSLKSGNLVTSAALKNWKCPMLTPRSFNRRWPFTISAPSKF